MEDPLCTQGALQAKMSEQFPSATESRPDRGGLRPGSQKEVLAEEGGAEDVPGEGG